MKFEIVKEHEDGSATCTLDMTPEEAHYLLNWAFIELLKKGLDEGKKYTVTDEELNDAKQQSFPHLGNTEY